MDQTSYRIICEELRGVLRQVVRAGPDAVEGIGSIRCQASAVLYTLLLDHPIDRRGRCRSCRRPGAMVGLRRRPCRIHLRARYWLLHQPDQALLLSHLAHELARSAAPGPERPPDRSNLTMAAGIDPGDTDVLPRVETETVGPTHPTPPASGRPAPVSAPKVPWAGRSDPDHGGAGSALVHPAPPDAPGAEYPAPAGLSIPRTRQRPMTIRLPSPGRAHVRAERLTTAMRTSPW
ncbi:MAG: hypothetical protein M3Y48_21405 [Actinomycetota bacterium]|nr:hypothetical protein [Actinomycetota bacterium]